jgi:opacity protein-like surface antigen
MKKFIAIVFIVLVSIPAFSQVKFGLKAGVSTTSLDMPTLKTISSGTTSFTVNNITNQNSPVSYIAKQTFNKLDIPVMLGFKLGPLRLNAGPTGSLLINSPTDLISNPDYKNNYSKMTIGYQAGVGFDLFKRLTFDLRYEGSLKKYQNQIQNLAGTKVNLDDRPNAFLLSVGIIL